MPLLVQTASATSPDDSSEEGKLKALRKFVVECDDLLKLERWLGHFNFFEVLDLAEHEIRHSNVLAWLFDPAENHGLRDLFLRRWLMRVFHDNVSVAAKGFDPVDVDCTSWRSVRIRREWKHIDLLIEMQDASGGRWVVVIENKVRSSQHSQQLARYRVEVERHFGDANRAFVLLSVNGEQPEDEQYLVATYQQVWEVLRACLREQRGAVADEPRMLLENYCKVIESRFMPNSKIEELALKIYAQHRQALEVIFEHRPDLAQTLSEKLEETVRERAPLENAKGAGRNKGKVYMLPNTWALASAGNDKGQIAWVSIEFTNMREVLFRPVARRTTPDWRWKLYEIAPTLALSDSTRYKRIPDEWPLYSARGSHFRLDTADSTNLEELAARIWEWCVEKLRESRFSTVLGLVAKELQAIVPPAALASADEP